MRRAEATRRAGRAGRPRGPRRPWRARGRGPKPGGRVPQEVPPPRRRAYARARRPAVATRASPGRRNGAARLGSCHPSEKDRRPLNGPERAERADGVARERRDPAGPADLENSERAFESDDEEHEGELTDLNANVE